MPISFRALAGGEASMTVTYNGHKIALRYDPSEVSENTVRAVIRDMRARAQAIEEEASQEGVMMQAIAQFDAQLFEMEITNALICRFVTWWDMVDDDGRSMFPLDMERLGDLPAIFRRQVVTDLMEDMRMGEQNGTPSKTHSRKRS